MCDSRILMNFENVVLLYTDIENSRSIRARVTAEIASVNGIFV